MIRCFIAGFTLFFIPRAGGDMIRIVPNCDEVCRKNSLLALYYAPNHTVAGTRPKTVAVNRSINPQPIMLVPQTQKFPTAAIRRPTVQPMHQRKVVKHVIQKPVVKKVVTTTSTSTREALPPVVRVVPQRPIVQRIGIQPQQPVVVVQPRYFIPEYYYPQQPIGYPVAAQPQDIIPFGRSVMSGINEKINSIYHILSELRQKYLQIIPAPPKTVFITSIVTKATPYTVSPSTSVKPVSAVVVKKTTQSSSNQATVTVTKYITQAPPSSSKNITVTITSSISQPKKNNINTVDCVDKPHKRHPTKNPRHPRRYESESNSDFSHSYSDKNYDKPPYLIKADKSDDKRKPKREKENTFARCYLMARPSDCASQDDFNIHGDFIYPRPNLYHPPDRRDSVGDDDRILYLSDLLASYW